MQKGKALRIGIDKYLAKPFEVDELLLCVKKMMINYNKRKGIS